jgi:hypothetical protein
MAVSENRGTMTAAGQISSIAANMERILKSDILSLHLISLPYLNCFRILTPHRSHRDSELVLLQVMTTRVVLRKRLY